MDRALPRRRWTARRTLGVAAALAGLGVVGRVLVFADASPRRAVEGLTISTVRAGTFQESIPVTGTIAPIRTVFLDAVEGGRVESIRVEAGALVQEGEEILRLSNANLLLDAMVREAQLVQLDNELRNTRFAIDRDRLTTETEILDLDRRIETGRVRYENARSLHAQGFVSMQQLGEERAELEYLEERRRLAAESHESELRERSSQVAQLEDALGRVRRNLRVVEETLERLTLRAPVAGQLTSLNAEIGETKGAGERLGRIDVLDGYQVRAEVDEHYVSRVPPGARGYLVLGDEAHALVVRKVYPEVVDGRFEVDLGFVDGQPESVRRGQSVPLRLELGDRVEAVLLERGSFFQSTGGRWVYVLDESGKQARRRPVRLGRHDPDVFEVLDGLNPGERVITSSYESFDDEERLVLK